MDQKNRGKRKPRTMGKKNISYETFTGTNTPGRKSKRKTKDSSTGDNEQG
jgi:hypothetical protein